jgi:hypothetical protein
MSAAASTVLDFSVDFAGPRLRLDEPGDGLFVLGTTGTPEKQDHIVFNAVTTWGRTRGVISSSMPGHGSVSGF